jgi:hypothetical protein
VRLMDWIVVVGGALVGWALVSWLITIVRQQRAPPLDMKQAERAAALPAAVTGVPATATGAPLAAEAGARSTLSLAELSGTWHAILGVSANARLEQIEAAYRAGLAQCERDGASNGGAAAAARRQERRAHLEDAYEFARALRARTSD